MNDGFKPFAVCVAVLFVIATGVWFHATAQERAQITRGSH